MRNLDNRGLFDKEYTKRAVSYKGLIPSLDFNEDFYLQFLEYATTMELENDIINRQTIEKIARINTYRHV